MSNQAAGPNPFAVAQQWMANQYEKGLREYHRNHEERMLEEALALHTAHNPTVQKQTYPTPASTGAPLPGYRIRQTPTPTSTGAPMPGTLPKQTSIHPITGAKVKPTPVKRKGSKPTAPGTKPKKK